MTQVPKERIPEAVPVEAIRKIERERNGTIAQASALLVRDQSDSDLANVYLRKLTAAIKMVNNRFTEIMAPQKEALRQIKALKEEILRPLEGSKTELNQRLMIWRTAERERIAEERAKVEAKEAEEQAKVEAEEERRRKIQEAHRQQGHQVSAPVELERPAPLEKPAPLEATDTTQVRKQTVYEVVDFSKVPPKFCFNDLAKIRRKMNTVENEDGTTTSSISVWPTDKPGLFLMVNGENIKNAASEIPGIEVSIKEVPVYA